MKRDAQELVATLTSMADPYNHETVNDHGAEVCAQAAGAIQAMLAWADQLDEAGGPGKFFALELRNRLNGETE